MNKKYKKLFMVIFVTILIGAGGLTLLFCSDDLKKIEENKPGLTLNKVEIEPTIIVDRVYDTSYLDDFIYIRTEEWIKNYMNKEDERWIYRFNQEMIDETMEAYKTIPDNLISSLKDDGFTITFIPFCLNDSTKLNDQSCTWGRISWNYKYVWVSSEAEEKGIVLLHELGHYVDRKNGLSSNSTLFYDMFREAKKRGYVDEASNGNYTFKDTSEFYAQSFAYCLSNTRRDNLDRLNLGICEYIEKDIKNIN